MRTLEKRFTQDMPQQSIWYGVDDIVGQASIIIMEGDLDCYMPCIVPSQLTNVYQHYSLPVSQ